MASIDYTAKLKEKIALLMRTNAALLEEVADKNVEIVNLRRRLNERR